MRIRFSKQQEQQYPTTKKSTTKKCDANNPCSKGFVCQKERCLLKDATSMPQVSDSKLVERFNKKLAMMVHNGDISYQQANGLKRMRFFRPAVSMFLQNKISLDQYKQTMRNEQKRRLQQYRKRQEQQEQQYY